MSFRQIIVQLDEDAASGLRAKAAADFANRYGAHLTGVFLTSEYVRQYMAAESLTALPADVVQQVLSGHEAAVAKVAEAARAQFEAARALQDAWPILERAETVHVLTVSPDGEGNSDGLLEALLARHGVKAELITDPSQDESAVDVIARQVAELGADLLVMGLYGRPRLQELLLGGVSRAMVAASPIPIFASH